MSASQRSDWVGCESGKVPYRSQELADRAARGAAKGLPYPLTSYRCGDCGQWHLTKRRRRRVAERAKAGKRSDRKRRQQQRARSPRPVGLTVVAAPAQREQSESKWLPSDPISAKRRRHWERMAAERDLANLRGAA